MSSQYRLSHKECAKEYAKQYYIDNKESYVERRESNKEVIKIHAKEWEEKNKERRTEYRKKYYEENKEPCKNKIYRYESREQYYIRNREHSIAYSKQYYKENREQRIEYSKSYNERNKEFNAEYNRIYYKSHSKERVIYQQKREALKLLVPSTLTIKQWLNVEQYFDNKCCYCGKKLPLAQEHFIPVTKGGEYTANNIIPSCMSCNSSKGNRAFSTWYPKFKHYSKKREEFILEYLG